MLGACAGSVPPVASGPDRPVLPAAPANFGRPVDVKAAHAGDDARAYAAREKAGRLSANQRLRNDAAFYRDVTSRFGEN